MISERGKDDRRSRRWKKTRQKEGERSCCLLVVHGLPRVLHSTPREGVDEARSFHLFPRFFGTQGPGGEPGAETYRGAVKNATPDPVPAANKGTALSTCDRLRNVYLRPSKTRESIASISYTFSHSFS